MMICIETQVLHKHFPVNRQTCPLHGESQVTTVEAFRFRVIGAEEERKKTTQREAEELTQEFC